MEAIIMLLVLAVLAVPVAFVLLLTSVLGLKRRVADLERAVGVLQHAAPARREAPAPAPAALAQPGTAPAASEPTLAELVRRQADEATPAPAPAQAPAGSPLPPPLPPAREPAAAATRATASPQPRIAAVPRRPAAENPVLRVVKRWFTVGNVPVKIGVLVALAGVAALLKYASDQGLFQVPLELRLAGIAAAAVGALVFAWRRREHNRVFALSLQGGAIGTLLLVVFAAFKLYGMIDAGPAFALSVVLVAGAALLAVLQNSQNLAAFALLAGYLAPIWLSTGSGNHVALFSYYALVNAAVVAIAWFKAWRLLNLLGFVFTFGIGTVWGASAYVPEKYASTQPFLALFFVFYLLVPLLFARRRPEGRRDLVDGCLVFGTPLVAFSLQAALLEGERMQLAFCALGLAALYAALAWMLLRRRGYELLGQSHAVLAVGFATLAVPLGLSARATASVFALEGAGLVWLGLRRGRLLPQGAGVTLQLAAAVAMLFGYDHAHEDVRAVLNPTAMGMLLLAVAGWASAWAARAHGRTVPAAVFYLWGMAWWAGNCAHEISRFADPALRADLALVLAGATGWLAAEVHRRRPAALLAQTLLAAVALAAPFLFWQGELHQHPLGGGFGALAWLVFGLLGVRGLACLRTDDGSSAGAAQLAWWLLWTLLLSVEGYWVALEARFGQGWEVALVALPWLVLIALSLWRFGWLALPRDATVATPMRTPVLWLGFAVAAAIWLVVLNRPLSPAPLPWLPLLNPAELVQLATLALAAAWLRPPYARGLERLRPIVLAGGGFLLLSASTLRSVHYWGGIGWDGGLLGTGLAQTSLTVVWSVLGVLGWVLGSRRGQRGLWMAGAVLMGVVLAKLVLVDRSHLGNLTGIVSFIAYGVLCMIVGYLAPAPPRTAANVENA
ncbi:DUF2339 domain-containing protein [Pseudoxanthomonas suwonensis]|nr:DUF2339 domain-containing protein [Pseudoxanthomonas suwonensis]